MRQKDTISRMCVWKKLNVVFLGKYFRFLLAPGGNLRRVRIRVLSLNASGSQQGVWRLIRDVGAGHLDMWCKYYCAFHSNDSLRSGGFLRALHQPRTQTHSLFLGLDNQDLFLWRTRHQVVFLTSTLLGFRYVFYIFWGGVYSSV